NRSHGGEVELGVSVGIAGVPAGDFGVVVEHVAHVPTEDHVAKTEPLGRRRLQLVEGHVFSSENAVDVEAPDLDLGDPFGLQAFDELVRIDHPRILSRCARRGSELVAARIASGLRVPRKGGRTAFADTDWAPAPRTRARLDR